jgi:hypothetical protein
MADPLADEALAKAQTQYWPPPGEEGEFLLAVGGCSLAVLYDALFVRSDFMVRGRNALTYIHRPLRSLRNPEGRCWLRSLHGARSGAQYG